MGLGSALVVFGLAVAAPPEGATGGPRISDAAAISGSGAGSTTLKIMFTGKPGHRYGLQGSPDLGTGSWVTQGFYLDGTLSALVTSVDGDGRDSPLRVVARYVH